MRCALSRGSERRVGEANVRVASARVTANDPWLPQNPELTLTAAQRRAAGESTANWSASLAVELEIAGQRGARRASAEAERESQQRLLVAAERSAAAEALSVYFSVLAAREETALLGRLVTASSRAFEAAHAAADRGAASGVEAEVLDATRISVERRKLLAERDEATARATLGSLLGQSAAEHVEVTGSLTPLPEAARVRARAPLADSAEVLALSAERSAAERKASALRRSRVPNPRISVFVQRDGFAEDVLGVGLSFPLTLPEPLGHTSRGAIAENEALAQRAAILIEKARREAGAELTRALASYDAARATVALLDESRVARAERSLVNLASETQGGRLAIREAVVLQQPLLELLLAAVEAKKALCLASVEVVRFSGLALEGGGK